jgi:hypothetical protein
MGSLVVGRSFGFGVSGVAVGMSGVSAAMRGPGKEASECPRLLCGRQLAAKATPAPRSVRESVVRVPPLAFIRRPGESLLSTRLRRWRDCQIPSPASDRSSTLRCREARSRRRLGGRVAVPTPAARARVETSCHRRSLRRAGRERDPRALSPGHALLDIAWVVRIRFKPAASRGRRRGRRSSHRGR